MNSKLIKIGGVILLVIVALSSWWFLYYTKTPTYSLGIVKTAIEQHDTETFKKHVELDTFIDSAIDDFIASDDKVKEMQNNPLAAGLIQMLKPTLIDISKKRIYTIVEKGNDNVDTSQTSSDGMNSVASSLPAMNNKSFVGIGKTTKNGKTSTVEINVKDDEINDNFTFIISMREMNDGTWQVTKINNLSDYLKKVNEAHLQQLKEYLETCDRVMDENGYGKEIYFAAKNVNNNMTAENIKKYHQARDKANEAISKIPVPPGAKEYVAIRQQRDANQKTGSLLILRNIEQGNISPEEYKQFQVAEQEMNNARNKLNEMQKKVYPNYNPAEEDAKKKEKYEGK